MNSEGSYDAGEALSVLEVCDPEFEVRPVSVVLYFSPNTFNGRWRFGFYQGCGKKQVS